MGLFMTLGAAIYFLTDCQLVLKGLMVRWWLNM